MEPATKRRKLSDELIQPMEDVDSGKQEESRHSLFVRSLPASVTSERLIEHFSQSYPLKHATVVLDPTTKISRGFGFVTFADAEDAKQALEEFNNSVLDGRKIKVEFSEARHRDVEDRIEGGKTKSVNTKGQELRAKRQQQQEENQPPKLIVRNLPWSIKTADDLSKLFLSYGKVKHAVVPKLPTNKAAQAGFGIVILRGRKNAERALEGVNGKVVDGRTIAVDWAVDKETWQKVQQGQSTDSLDTGAAEDNQAAAKPEGQVSSDDEDEGGVLANEDAQSSDADALDDGGEDSDEEDDDEIDEEEDLDLDASDISSLAASEPTTTATNFNTENTTIFIRNLPYDADDETVFEHFKTHFGPVRYARVVYDAATERPRGTAFVCFRNEDDAKECVKSCPKPESPTANAYKSAPSILQNTSADPTGKYTLNGRLLHVTRALPKTEADRRTVEGETARREKLNKDKRRLYLISEGTVSASSALGQKLSKADLDAREASLKQRQKLIKTNPNLGFSLTRLSIRNLPRWVDSKMLKQLAREAIVGFASDVSSGIREPISKEELAREGEAGKQADAERKEKGKGVIRQAKIVFESELTGGKVGDGKGGRSRGYGFLEFWTHRNALMGLRWLNGHLVKKPADSQSTDDMGEKGKRLIVEFAIENAQVVQRRDDREKRVRDRQTRDRSEYPKNGERFEKRKRDDGDRERGSDNKRQRFGKEKKPDNQRESVNGNQKDKLDAKSQDEKNKIAARNRIIAQKRQKRRTRRG